MFTEKIKALRISKGLNKREMSELLKLPYTTYNNYETGTREPNSDILIRIANLFSVSVDYLLGNTNEIDPFQFDNIFPIETRKIPMLGEIACGVPIVANQEFDSYVEVGTDVKADICLKARGDSMIGARINNGDIVFIRKQPTVENGEIAAVIIDDEATLKRVYLYPNKMVLNSENPAFDPLVYVGEELEHVKILGKAIAFQSDL